MSFKLRYDQLKPVTSADNGVRAGIVSYNGDDPEHRAIMRESLPRFLGPVGAVHGVNFPKQHIDVVAEAFDKKIMGADFLQVAVNPNAPIEVAGLATGASTFSAESDKQGNLKIYPIWHGEDLAVDEKIAALFREYTKCLLYPKGIGMGTWFMREQIIKRSLRSSDDPDWVFAGRDNEHCLGNLPIVGVMDKFGNVRGTEKDSAILEINRPTPRMKERFGLVTTKEDLPADALGIAKCPNNFLIRCSSDDGAVQFAAIGRRLADAFDEAKPVVWLRIGSNNVDPGKEMLKEILASLIASSYEEVADRGWGTPRGKLYSPNGLTDLFVVPNPDTHIHANNQEAAIEAMLAMDAKRRKFGHENLVSGYMKIQNVGDQIATFGQKLSEPTVIKGLDFGEAANGPLFDLGEKPKRPLAACQTDKKLFFPAAA